MLTDNVAVLALERESKKCFGIDAVPGAQKGVVGPLKFSPLSYKVISKKRERIRGEGLRRFEATFRT
jgi:hypothetical protein